MARLLSPMWRGYQSCGEVTQPSVARLPNLLGETTCCEVTLWRGYSHVTVQYYVGISNISTTFWFSSSFSAILHLNFIGKHIGQVLDHGMPNLFSVLTTLKTKTETNTAIHSSQFDSVGRRPNGHLLAALPCQK